jgi:hypothetical protein
MLPVLDDGALVGVLTDTALSAAEELRALDAEPAAQTRPQVERIPSAPLVPVEE